MIAIQVIFILLLIVLAIPVLVFAFQVLLSLLPYRSQKDTAEVRPPLAVLIPAHNEGEGILATLRSLKPQLGVDDRIVVVADNCNDNTAEVARQFGVTVVERFDEIRRGKGYALDFGVRYLENNQPPAIVVIVDADCELKAGALDRLCKVAHASDRPVQALYLMYAPAGASLKTKIAEFAWTVKNWTRAIGYHQLKLPCHLMGTGMAFPWAHLARASLASGHIVEDMKLGLDFAAQGYAPLFCPEAMVTSYFPVNVQGVKSQRTRWEHGHLGMIATEGLPNFIKAIQQRNTHLLALVMDMSVPPLALLTLVVAMFAMAAGFAIIVTDHWLPWVLSPVLFGILAIGVLVAWAKFGRNTLSLSDLAFAPIYALAKIPVYCRFMVRRQVEWVRSKRD